MYIQRYGIPPVGSEKWFECRRCGCSDEEEDADGEGEGLGLGLGLGVDEVGRGLRGGLEGLDEVLRRGEEEEVEGWGEGGFVW